LNSRRAKEEPNSYLSIEGYSLIHTLVETVAFRSAKVVSPFAPRKSGGSSLCCEAKGDRGDFLFSFAEALGDRLTGHLYEENGAHYLAVWPIHFDEPNKRVLISLPVEADSGAHRVWISYDYLKNPQGIPA
jgi:hypothetical protein